MYELPMKHFLTKSWVKISGEGRKSTLKQNNTDKDILSKQVKLKITPTKEVE